MDKYMINGIDFMEMELQKYWSMPSSYDKEKKQETLNTMLYSDDYVASEKKDGYAQLVIKDDSGKIAMRSRNKGVNGWICKHEWLPHLNDFFSSLPAGTCVLGEVYLKGKTSKSIVSILGCLKDKAIERQKKDEDKLRFYIFDILAYDGELTYQRPIRERISLLRSFEDVYKNDYVDYAKYWYTPEDIRENWLRILAEGGEGVVLTKKDYPYEFNKRTARKTLKLKKELEETIDVFLTGRWKKPTYLYTGKDLSNWDYWYDKINDKRVSGKLSDRAEVGNNLDAVTRLWYHGMAGAIEIAVMRDGEPTPIGWISGIEDDIRLGIVNDPRAYVGKVCEIQAMEIDRSAEVPTLRHAKIINWRDDKSAKDCTWEQLL